MTFHNNYANPKQKYRQQINRSMKDYLVCLQLMYNKYKYVQLNDGMQIPCFALIRRHVSIQYFLFLFFYTRYKLNFSHIFITVFQNVINFF